MSSRTCPRCGMILTAAEGRRARCPSCGKERYASQKVIGSIWLKLIIVVAFPAFAVGILMFTLDPPLVWQGLVCIVLGIAVVPIAVRAFKNNE